MALKTTLKHGNAVFEWASGGMRTHTALHTASALDTTPVLLATHLVTLTCTCIECVLCVSTAIAQDEMLIGTAYVTVFQSPEDDAHVS